MAVTPTPPLPATPRGGLEPAADAFGALARASGPPTAPDLPEDTAPAPAGTTSLRPARPAPSGLPAPTAPPAPPAPRRATPSAVSLLGPQGVPPAPKYRVVTEVGRGGMGRVLRVQDNDLRREVAMKVLADPRPALVDVARFLEEAQVTGRLEHPGIVPVHELGVNEDGQPYFTMKLLADARTLADVIADLRAGDPGAHRRFTFDRRVAVIQQVCQALAHAHARGVVHRDIKPANILVGPTGEVYLVDWGISAAAAGPVPGGAAPAVESTVVGTPAYMAPEQARGEPADPRSDLYSLCAVLYELLALEHYLGFDLATPAGGTQLDLVVTRVPLEAEAHVDPVAGRVPRVLSRLCRKGLAKDPKDRFQSALELEVALQSWQEGCGPVVCPGTALQRGLSGGIRWIDRHPFAAPLLAYGLLAVAVAGAAGWLREVWTLLAAG